MMTKPVFAPLFLPFTKVKVTPPAPAAPNSTHFPDNRHSFSAAGRQTDRQGSSLLVACHIASSLFSSDAEHYESLDSQLGLEPCRLLY